INKEKSNLHDQVQLASLSITKKLRYAKTVSIVSNWTACPSIATLRSDLARYGHANYICVNASDPHSIKNIVYDPTTNDFTAANLVSDSTGRTSFGLTVFRTQANILHFGITGTTSSQNYAIESDLTIMNLASASDIATAISTRSSQPRIIRI